MSHNDTLALYHAETLAIVPIVASQDQPWRGSSLTPPPAFFWPSDPPASKNSASFGIPLFHPHTGGSLSEIWGGGIRTGFRPSPPLSAAPFPLSTTSPPSGSCAVVLGEMAAYYNEIDPYCAAWLRNLIGAGLIAPGDVDERDVRDVVPTDLAGYAQCHFFAGIGGWSLALRLAGWRDERPVWTGSCPCQPFSAAGARRGFADERHLWPAWHWLIGQCEPPVVFGEQVARASDWLRLVRSDLEALGYAVGAMPIEAACVGADHARDRFWIVADIDRETKSILAVDAEMAETPESASDSDGSRLPGRGQAGKDGEDARNIQARDGFSDNASRIVSRFDWPHQPVVGGELHGIPGRVDAVRAYGNAIVPQVAAEVIRAYMELRP